MNNGSNQAPYRILVADDDRTMRLLIRRAMEQEGYQVFEANNGEECLNAYTRCNPNVVLLDALMPVMDGFTCCVQLQHQIDHNRRLDPSRNQTLVLMITGLEDSESVNLAFESGAVDYVTKPINWAVLRQRVRRLIQQVELYQKLQAANQMLERLAALDGLTQVPNRRRFDEYLMQEWRHMAREQAPLSLILCDVDCFKNYNDTYGHLLGDACLQQVAEAISQTLSRSTDFVARYGGEEFAVILPDTNIAGAVKVAANIRAAVSDLRIAHTGSVVANYVTISLGAVSMVPDYYFPPETLVAAADKALYLAKCQGRDRCCTVADPVKQT